MSTLRSCPWCHQGVRLPTGGAPVYCDRCGHRADVHRGLCSCDACKNTDDESATVALVLLAEFFDAWTRLEAVRLCDAVFSREWWRLLAMFRDLGIDPAEAEAFIRREAARMPLPTEEEGAV